MLVTNVSELRKNLKSYIDSVSDNNDTLIVHSNGKTVVMISLQDYNSYDQTEYLTRTTANKERLDSAIKNFNNNKVKERKLVEHDANCF